MFGFFHPFCDAGGGGEKVLIQAIKAMQEESDFKEDLIMVYSGSEKPDSDILAHYFDRFGIQVSQKKNSLTFLKITKHGKMHGTNYPSFTLLW